ncbi:MAG TPA: type II secretion system protein [Desulfuromonadales bacterium]|nr:type II secretion system protein [Desulfuromonadales bacterium]
MPTSTAGNWNKESGFTLIELTIVVLLLGLFSALVIPRLPGVGADGLKSSARRIAGTVKYFFNEAALSGRPHRLEYNLDEGTFRVRRLEADGELVELSGTGREQRLKGQVRFKDIAIPGRGSFSQGEVATEIQPVGWVEETVVHLEEEDGRTLTLRIMPYTGTTEVFDGYREFD